MGLRLKFFLTALVGLLIGLSIQLFDRANCQNRVVESSYIPQEESSPPSPHANSPFFSEEQLRQKAKSITVKVLSGQNSGSGILINKQGEIYTVVTNDHVLIFGQPNQAYRIQTPDGQIYPARVVKGVNFNHKDLGLVQFSSQQDYPVVSLSKSAKSNLGDEVFASGFPFADDVSQSRGFVFTKGKIEMFSQQPFGGGYQIGYSNRIQKGMSGGPVFNRQGEIIAINGKHKYPLWGNYLFDDGSTASPEKKAAMSKLSWAIPIHTFLELAPQFAAAQQATPTPTLSRFKKQKW
jgi:S1-C subfamily serine protease